MITKNLSRTIFFLIAAGAAGLFFWFVVHDYNSPRLSEDSEITVTIQPGDGAWEVSKEVANKGLVRLPVSFLFGVWRDGLIGDFQPGEYRVHNSLSSAEIARILSPRKVKKDSVQVTFPEGWTMDEMAQRLNKNGLAGDDFLRVAKSPPRRIVEPYRFLSDLPDGATLEGYLFPDTYRFSLEATGEEIVKKMLETFDKKVSNDLYASAEKQKRTIRDIVIMASIVEGEVRSTEDRQTVSGIFWNRLTIGMPLQSDATLEYVLRTGVIQHSIEQTKINSPYNTYTAKGLPPGPVSNPSLDALFACVQPKNTEYLYFLSNPKTGETYFGRTFDEHIANKQKAGL